MGTSDSNWNHRCTNVMKKTTRKIRKKSTGKPVVEHYYICSECAEKKKFTWPKGHCATQHFDICGYCNENKALCAVTDWLRPGQKKMRLEDWD